jgi:serine/threonine protein kinase
VDRIADYQLVRSLGEGNHGEFFLATPPGRLGLDAEFVAVKVLGGGGSGEDTFRRTTRELRAFAAVRSPYLTTLLDAGQDGTRFFYAMPYFPLGSLAAPARPLDRSEILRALEHASLAAHALHEAGIVHRGIKPANVLLHEGGARLSDLGLAQVLAPGQTMTGMGPVGSVEFLDPAILRGERASRGSDVWSLGVTLHRALSGSGLYGPLPDTDPLLGIRKVLSSTPQLSPRLSAAEAEVVRACLAPDPADRPPTAAALAERVAALA